MKYLCELFGIFPHGRFVFSPSFINLFHYLFMSLWTHGYSFYTLGYNPIPFYCSYCSSFGHLESFQLAPKEVYPFIPILKMRKPSFKEYNVSTIIQLTRVEVKWESWDSTARVFGFVLVLFFVSLLIMFHLNIVNLYKSMTGVYLTWWSCLRH